MERILQAFASGMSLGKIAKMLNDEGVSFSQNPRVKGKRSWSKTAILTILKNERYIGKRTWGRTVQTMNPETGKYTVRKAPECEWLRDELPALRIVSDDLWNQVQKQFVLTTRGFGVKRMGGMSRTERSSKYLFSGLLRCGVCKRNMTVTTTSPARYGCADHRNRHTCFNKTTILLDVLESAFLAALAENLASKELREELIAGLLDHLKTENLRSSERSALSEKEREQTK